MKPDLIPVIGVDIGKRRDPTAIAVVEIEVRPVEAPAGCQRREEAHYLVRMLGRLPINTPYPDVVRRIESLCHQVRKRTGLDPFLFIDATGVGLPIVDQLKASHLPVQRLDAVLFTGGNRRNEKREEGRVLLGKAFLVSRLQTLLQFQRIHLPKSSEATALAQELRSFEIRVDDNARQRSGAFRVGTHDDLVTALGLAVQKEPTRKASSGSDRFEL